MPQKEARLYKALIKLFFTTLKIYEHSKSDLNNAEFEEVLALLYSALSQASRCRAKTSKAFNHRLSLIQIGYDALSTANLVLLKRTIITMRDLGN